MSDVPNGTCFQTVVASQNVFMQYKEGSESELLSAPSTCNSIIATFVAHLRTSLGVPPFGLMGRSKVHAETRWNGTRIARIGSNAIFADEHYAGERIVMYSRHAAKTRHILNEFELVIEWCTTRFSVDPSVYKYPLELYFPHGVKLRQQLTLLRHAAILITPDGFSMSFGLFLPRDSTIIILQVSMFVCWTRFASALLIGSVCRVTGALRQAQRLTASSSKFSTLGLTTSLGFGLRRRDWALTWYWLVFITGAE